MIGLRQVRAATSVGSLAPCGGGLGWGVPKHAFVVWTPTPDPSPQGGGEKRPHALIDNKEHV
jgi:hypothetical protein